MDVFTRAVGHSNPAPVADKKTELAYVIGSIFLASLAAPIVILGWSLFSAIFG